MSPAAPSNEPTRCLHRLKTRPGQHPHTDSARAEPPSDPATYLPAVPDESRDAGEPTADGPALAVERLAQALKALPPVGTDFLGFHLVAELGRGGSSKVYLARQGDLADRLVALKVSADVHEESQALAQLQHTNVVPIFSAHRVGPLHAVCMPYFGPTTLADVLHDLARRESLPASGKDLLSALYGRHGTAPAEPAAPPRTTSILRMLATLSHVDASLWIVARVAEGLAHAHERGILHLDLKPANVLLTDEGQPMLLDFNTARDTKRRPGARAEQVGGTLPYMAPEHLDAFRGRDRAVDARSDVYALGVILFELLTGRRPFPAQDDVEQLGAMIAARRGRPPRLRRRNPAVSPAVEAVVRRCLEPDPARRYQSAQDLQEDLQRHLKDLPLRHTPEPSARERARKWVRRHPRLASWTTAGALAAAAVAALTGLAAVRGQQLARLEAAAALGRFDADARSAQFLLTARTRDPGQLDRGIALGRELLGRYQVHHNPRWTELPAVRHLSAEDQGRLRQGLGELLLLVAQGVSLRAEGDAGGPADADLALEALALNRRAEACFPAGDQPRALWLQRAQLLNLLGDDGAAHQARAAAEATPPRTARDHYLLGTEHAARGRYREALPYFEAAARRDPQAFWPAFLQGLCHDRLGQDADALACFRACAALRPDFAWTYANRGLVYLRQQDYPRAHAEFDRALALQPDQAEAYVNRAQARQGLGRYPEAVADLTRALDLGAPPTRVYLLRAAARERLGDKEGAGRDRAAGLRARPADASGWVARGAARFGTDPHGALADFEEALRLNPRSLAALQNKARVLGESGRTEEALQALDTAVALYPDFVPARMARAVLLARLGRREAAHRDAREALRRDAGPPTLYRAAVAYALTSREAPEDRSEALRLLASALRQGFGLDLLDADRDLDPIRGDAEFRDLAAAARALGGGGAW
jgi:serine/threonine protein kinase/tetratricopeptide (TPR) repeat protein